MNIRKIQDADVKNKKVLLRVDLNVAVENGKAKELFKIKSIKETLEYLLKKNAKVALLTYFGRPGGKKDPKYSLSQMKGDLKNILGHKIKFVSDCIGEKVKKTSVTGVAKIMPSFAGLWLQK